MSAAQLEMFSTPVRDGSEKTHTDSTPRLIDATEQERERMYRELGFVAYFKLYRTQQRELVAESKP